MTALSRDERLARLDTMIAECRILRGAWTRRGARGRNLACLLAALSPEVGDTKIVLACPADVIPRWFAYLTPSMNDRVSVAAWPVIIRRYAAVVRRAAVLTAEDWRRLDYAARAVVLRVALPHAGTSTTVVELAIALCDRAVSGETVALSEWTAARLAAEEAWEERPARAAWAAARAAAVAVADAAAEAAIAAGCVAGDGNATAEAAAWDTIANGVLDAIDAACAAREASS